MKTIAVSADSTAVLKLLDAAREDDLFVQAADGTEFLVSAIDEFDAEIARTRRSEKLMTLLDERAAQAETIPLDEVRRRLGLQP